MVKLATWSGRSTFQYQGSVMEGVKIYTGKLNQMASVRSAVFFEIIEKYQGTTTVLGCSKDTNNQKSIGYWFHDRFDGRSLMGYIGMILVREGYAEKASKSEITIFER